MPLGGVCTLLLTSLLTVLSLVNHTFVLSAGSWEHLGTKPQHIACYSIFPWVTHRENPTGYVQLAHCSGEDVPGWAWAWGRHREYSSQPVPWLSPLPSQFSHLSSCHTSAWTPSSSLQSCHSLASVDRERRLILLPCYDAEVRLSVKQGWESSRDLDIWFRKQRCQSSGSGSALELSHMIAKGRQDTWACSVPCD